jgi:ATP-dependent DNA helicase RecQ
MTSAPIIDQEKVSSILKKIYGFDEFRFVQKEVVDSILSQKDTLAIMPTGGGKSLCYQLPALYFDGLTIVISPLISLMQDQVTNLKQYNVPSAFLNSTLAAGERRDLEEKLANNEIKLLYIAPESLLMPHILRMLKSLKVSLFAIDEAHCVSQWGHEFRKDYTRLNSLKTEFPDVPTVALTATADERTRTDICDQLGLTDPSIFVSDFDRPNIKYSVYERKNEITQLTQFIRSHHQGDVGIVYCLSRKKVERVAKELNAAGFKAVAYHAGLPTKERSFAQERFNKEDELIVVATIAFGMGIDRPDVRFVAHLDLPKSIEGYYQETGRAGRDGQPANAWMVFGLQDVVKLNQMLENTDAGEDYKKFAKLKLDAMLTLAESAYCRRKILLEYFGKVDGQEIKEKCNNCDACLEPQDTWDATVDIQKVLSTIYKTGQIFGASYVIQVLRGSVNAKINERTHDQLSVYGIGKEQSLHHWNSIIRQLLGLKVLFIKNWEYRNLGLAEKARPILKSEETLFLKKIKEQSTSAAKKEKKKKKLIEMTHDHPDLFEKLRVLRRSIAQEGSIPPFMVFSDRTLNDMCLILPRSKEDMLLVHGIGQSKLEKFGDPFLTEIQDYQHEAH